MKKAGSKLKFYWQPEIYSKNSIFYKTKLYNFERKNENNMIKSRPKMIRSAFTFDRLFMLIDFYMLILYFLFIFLFDISNNRKHKSKYDKNNRSDYIKCKCYMILIVHLQDTAC